jgi:hypothetical protein
LLGPEAVRAPVIRVRGLEEARLAAGAAAALNLHFCLSSQVAASGYAGAGWFARLAAVVRQEYPGVVALAILDCGDRAGDVMAGIEEGVDAMVFSGPAPVAKSLQAMAQSTGLRLFAALGPGLDLSRQADPSTACRAWLQASIS